MGRVGLARPWRTDRHGWRPRVHGRGHGTYLRAFDSATGKELWKGELPASAQSIPATYEFGGRQYVVISAGGHGKLGTKMGDAVVAFALP
jgi:quinoprotein glucose dehydrogenase